jgi:hypothetical protein
MGAASEAFAEGGVAGGQTEEGEARGDEKDVEHGCQIRRRPVPVTVAEVRYAGLPR